MSPSSGEMRPSATMRKIAARSVSTVGWGALSAAAIAVSAARLARPVLAAMAAPCSEGRLHLTLDLLAHPAHLLAQLLGEPAHLLAELGPAAPGGARDARCATAAQAEIAADDQLQPGRALA